MARDIQSHENQGPTANITLPGKTIIYNRRADKELPRQEKTEGALAGVAQWIERGLQTKWLPVQFPVRAHAWVVGQIPSRGCVRGQPHIDISLPLSPSLPLSLQINFLKEKTKVVHYYLTIII